MVRDEIFGHIGATGTTNERKGSARANYDTLAQ